MTKAELLRQMRAKQQQELAALFPETPASKQRKRRTYAEIVADDRRARGLSPKPTR